MEKTTVVKLRRKNGSIVQDCDVYIGRRCYMGGWKLAESKWANPYTIKEYKNGKTCVKLYEKYLLKNKKLFKDIKELRGKVLGCWCKKTSSDVCHGDILAKYANSMNNKSSEDSSDDSDSDSSDNSASDSDSNSSSDSTDDSASDSSDDSASDSSSDSSKSSSENSTDDSDSDSASDSSENSDSD